MEFDEFFDKHMLKIIIFQFSSRKMMENVEFVEMIGASNDLEKTRMEATLEPEQLQEPMFKDK